MANIETSYLGLRLKNPIIGASSGFTSNIDKIKMLNDAGIGAIVLKSLFEEQIMHDISRVIQTGDGVDYPEAADYIKSYTRDNSVRQYLDLINQAKETFEIPVIASINCFTANDWVEFARQIEIAGADAIELNVHVVNTDKNSDANDYGNLYCNIAGSVSKVVKIPVAIKLGSYFSNLVAVVNRLSVSGASGVVLFNRFYEPDIDIDKMIMTSGETFTNPADINRVLRWVAIVSDKVPSIDIAASTGIHDGQAVIKQLLAGAKAVQVCSAIYKGGPAVVTRMIDKLHGWMDDKGFASIDDFRGIMSYQKVQNAATYERAQFMKYFSMHSE